MAEKKVKLTESSMRGYTGHLFMTSFKDGVAVSPVSQRKQERILATVRSEVVGNTPENPKPTPEKADDSGE
ncbi:hypothetical protein PSI15_12350 [Xenorhabdus sp. PR6a]|uniref:hypothetical protein n=1 Tax=Xenorhabdus sp. PR6a TaxID=3025877 RepID=UPI0023597E20|nr:hypothetical protein [Xenorhabdus sp. PR6a]MDC9582344.1 hypothetical protein [Xenorhabdus sp. PR6a]